MRTYRGRDVLSLDFIEVDVEDTSIRAIRETQAIEDGVWICPGFVDLQVNGYGGIDLNSDTCDSDAVCQLVEKLASLGSTTFLPTIITASHAAMTARLAVIAEAHRRFAQVRHAVPCIHLEGPCISPLAGYRGAHPRADVREPSLVEFHALQRAAEGLIKMVTLSPHWQDAPEFIRALCDDGVIVSIGHTHASPEQIRAAADAGATLCTHLGNGIAAELPRHPNPLWSQLADDRLTATLIADGVHIPDEVLRVAIRAKGLDRVLLVSDSVSLAGSAPGRYHSVIGQDVEVGLDGSIRMGDTGLLAGSGIALKDAVAHVAGLQGCTLRDAVRMATVNPCGFLRDREGLLCEGAPADLLLLRWSTEKRALELVDVLVLGRSAV
ncbi:MAG: amidohydrolase family protein [Acidobacteriota bacterium]